MAEKKEVTDLAPVDGGGSKVENHEEAAAEKLQRLRRQTASQRLKSIVDDPDGPALVRALQPLELYWTFVETGAEDAEALLEFSSPEQLQFLLDAELWRGESFDSEKAIAWLTLLMETGEERLMEQLGEMDLELLVLLVKREISVGGGLGELVSDDERTFEWDHSFDNIYFITFRTKKNARLIGAFLDILFRRDKDTYLRVMESVKNETESELEEQALHFRNARLADHGFPARDEAVFIYSRMNPADFAPSTERKSLGKRTDNQGELLPVMQERESLLARALERLKSEALYLELNYLLNNALVVEGISGLEEEKVRRIMERVEGRINIALEYLCGSDDEKGAEILERESFSRLFRLGNGLLAQLRKKGDGLKAEGYEIARALNGLREEQPLFYRGFDEEMIDGYREFRTLRDLSVMENFLEGLRE